MLQVRVRPPEADLTESRTATAPVRFWLTVLAVLAIFGLAVRLGRGPEKFAASCLSANFFLSVIGVLTFGASTYTAFDPTSFAIDFATLFGVTWVALRANRVWPLVVSSLQLLVVFAHVSGLVYYGWNQVYWGMVVFPQYLQLMVVAVGIFSHHFREKRIGRYRSWRLDLDAPRSPDHGLA